MTYAILYKDNGDFLADYDSFEEARSALHDFVEEHPSIRHRVGMLEIDDSGHATRALDVESALAQPA
jgi:hypothetical protein